MDYQKYLKSYEWKRTRDERIAIDQKCQICGRPFDLNVHHMTYGNVPYEKMSDLITLCRFCHEKVESEKGRPYYESFSIVNKLICHKFIKEYKEKDYAYHGDLDFCELNTVKRYLYPYMKDHGANLDHISGTQIVKDYFRNRRYEVILNYIEHGAAPDDVFRKYKFSSNMVYKVFRDPDSAREFLSKEDLTYAET